MTLLADESTYRFDHGQLHCLAWRSVWPHQASTDPAGDLLTPRDRELLVLVATSPPWVNPGAAARHLRRFGTSPAGAQACIERLLHTGHLSASSDLHFRPAGPGPREDRASGALRGRRVMGMHPVTANRHLTPDVVTTVGALAAAALAGSWSLLQYDLHARTGRFVRMPPGPARVGVLVRGGSDGVVVETAMTWMRTDPPIVWAPSGRQISHTVRHCLAMGLSGQATALRVLTGERAVRYRVELNLHPDAAGPSCSAPFEQRE